MPNRILREGILTSDRVDQLDPPAEVFYRRLMSKVDDHGLYDARPAILRTSLYPLRVDRVREADIARWIAACEKAGVLALYERDGKPYLQMLDTKWQARSEPKFPLPPAPGCKQPPAPARNCTQTPAPAPVFVVVGGGVDAVDTPPPPAAAVGAFDQFWNLWPKHDRKVAKAQCQEKWAKKGCDAIAEQVLDSLRAWIASEAWAREEGAYIPAPLVWLNQARWETTPEPAADKPNGITVPSNAAAITAAEHEAEAARLADPAAKAASEEARRLFNERRQGAGAAA